MSASSGKTSATPALVHSVFLAIAIIMAGYFLASAVMQSQIANRAITAHGTASEIVTIDPANASEQVREITKRLTASATEAAVRNAHRIADTSGVALAGLQSATQSPTEFSPIAGADNPENPQTARVDVTVVFFLK